MKKLLLILLFALSFAAHAANPVYTLEIPLGTVHLKSQTNPYGKPYNNHQFGTGLTAGVRWESGTGPDYGMKVGTFKNSYFKQSNFVAADFGYNVSNKVRVGVMVGAVDGYGKTGKAQFFAAPQVDVALSKNSYLAFTLVPTNIKGGSAALAFSVGYKF